MAIKRRDFLRLSLLQAASLGLPLSARASTPLPKVNRRTGPSILQGATDDTRTQFSILHDMTENLVISVSDGLGGIWQPEHTERLEFQGEKDVLTKVYFSGLAIDREYTLLVATSQGALVDSRQFSMLDLQGDGVRFALCSCMDDSRHEPAIWTDLIEQRPDVILFVGDSVYADSEGSATPKQLWKRFSEGRRTLEIYYSKQLIPILAVWDDHDFGKNDSDSSYPYIPESQKNFLSFFAQDEKYCSILKRGPGISSALLLRGNLFFLLDDRSYRKVSGSTDRYAHWGQDQEQWMIELMRQHSGPTWMCNGSQIFPKFDFKESVSGDHPAQFKGMVEEVKKLSTRVVFVSGDVHYSEISKIESSEVGYQTVEITASSIHSPNIPGAPWIIPNKRRMMATASKNYVLVEAKLRGQGTTAQVLCRSKAGKVNFKYEIET